MSGVNTSQSGLNSVCVVPQRNFTLVNASIKLQRSFGCRLISTSKSILLRRRAQAISANRLLSLPFLSIVITSSRYGLFSTTSFSFSSARKVMCASGAALRSAWIKGVVSVRSPRCIKNVTNIFLPFNSTACAISPLPPFPDKFYKPFPALYHAYNASYRTFSSSSLHTLPAKAIPWNFCCRMVRCGQPSSVRTLL